MPKRYIIIPGDVMIVDPETKAPVPNADGTQQSISFQSFVQRLMHNPKWVENYANMRAQAAILEALAHKAWIGDNAVMELAEEDWIKLKDAVEHPKVEYNTAHGRQVVSGYGFHPTLASQLLPLASSIVLAESSRPPEEKAV